MTRKRKNWTEKLADSKDLPKVERITDKMSKRWGTGTVVIPLAGGGRYDDEKSV